MDFNITEHQHSDDDLQLAEPHFDEESTVLAARPVVPLEELGETDAGAGSKRYLTFGLSIIASLIIGGLGATLVFKQRGQRPAAEIVETATPGSGANASDSAESSASLGEVREGVTARPVASANPEPKKVETQGGKAVARPNPQLRPTVAADRVATAPTDVVSLEEERDNRRAERIEARRMRRMAARENQDGRGRGRRHSDDLLRIQEIFEGSRRP